MRIQFSDVEYDAIYARARKDNVSPAKVIRGLVQDMIKLNQGVKVNDSRRSSVRG